MTTEIAAATTATPPAKPRNLGMSARGVTFNDMGDLWRFATAVANSGLAPKGIEKPEAIVVAIQMGLEIGLSPMASLQNIAVINGRPSLWGDAMLAVCRSSGVFDESAFEETVDGEGQNRKATCTVRRLPNGKPYVSTFSMADAKQAGLQGKAGPWTQYPDRMLKMRARGYALRDTFGDFLRGMYTAEEVRDGFDDRENVRQVESNVTGPETQPTTTSAAIADQLRKRQTAEAGDYHQPAVVETATTEPQKTEPTEPKTATPEELDAMLSEWMPQVDACTTLTAVRKVQDQAAATVPMPDRKLILEALDTKAAELRKARDAAKEGKAEGVTA